MNMQINECVYNIQIKELFKGYIKGLFKYYECNNVNIIGHIKICLL